MSVNSKKEPEHGKESPPDIYSLRAPPKQPQLTGKIVAALFEEAQGKIAQHKLQTDAFKKIWCEKQELQKVLGIPGVSWKPSFIDGKLGIKFRFTLPKRIFAQYDTPAGKITNKNSRSMDFVILNSNPQSITDAEKCNQITAVIRHEHADLGKDKNHDNIRVSGHFTRDTFEGIYEIEKGIPLDQFFTDPDNRTGIRPMLQNHSLGYAAFPWALNISNAIITQEKSIVDMLRKLQLLERFIQFFIDDYPHDIDERDYYSGPTRYGISGGSALYIESEKGDSNTNTVKRTPEFKKESKAFNDMMTSLSVTSLDHLLFYASHMVRIASCTEYDNDDSEQPKSSADAVFKLIRDNSSKYQSAENDTTFTHKESGYVFHVTKFPFFDRLKSTKQRFLYCLYIDSKHQKENMTDIRIATDKVLGDIGRSYNWPRFDSTNKLIEKVSGKVMKIAIAETTWM